MTTKHEDFFFAQKFKAYCDEDSSFSEKVTTILQEILRDPSKNLQIAMSMCPDIRIREALTVILGLPSKEVDEEEEKEAAKARARAKAEEDAKLKKQKEAETRVKSPEEIVRINLV